MPDLDDVVPPSPSPGIAYWVAVIGLGWWCVMLTLSTLGCVAARRRYTSRPPSPLSHSTNVPGVSILRPLKGLDTNLYENLESTFRLEYHNYEILFSVADKNDQALPVVQSLMTRYPRVKASIIIGSEDVGVNPKVNNLVRSFREAVHDILWVLDSGVLVDPGTLARSIDIMTSPTFTQRKHPIALIHHVPVAVVGEGHIGSRLEAAFLNTNHAKMYIAINTVGIESCVVGKSNLYRRSDVERVNGSMVPLHSQPSSNTSSIQHGLRAFGKYLAEDNMIAAALWHELGLRHDLSCDVAKNVVGNMSFMDYVWRRVRWIRVRKHMVFVATLLEPFTESMLVCLIGALSARYIFGIQPLIFYLFHFAVWLSIDLDVYAAICGQSLSLEEAPGFLTAWLARELLAFPIFMLAIFGDEVIWRGQRYQVTHNGEARLCERPKAAHPM